MINDLINIRFYDLILIPKSLTQKKFIFEEKKSKTLESFK